MATMNEQVQDALIRHQVNLQRLGVGLSNEMIGLLDRTEASIQAEIRRALARGATVETQAGLRKLQFLEDAIREIRRDAFDVVNERVGDSMRDLVRHDAEFAAQLLETTSPVILDMALPDPKLLNRMLDTERVEGLVMEEWFDRLAEDDARRIMDKIRVGMTRGLSNQDIVRSVVGTDAFDGSEGTTQLTRRHVDALVRTATNQFSNSAREETFKANEDVVAAERYTATLDGRTSAICRSLDGKIYKVGEGPVPPRHFRCRSIRVAIVGAGLIGDRPMKPTTEKQLLGEYNDLNGLSARTRGDLPRGTRGDFDAYARKRVRELIGTVPAETTYGEFLKRQSAAFQDEILGKTKAKLFRLGDLTLDKFVHRDGTELTLKQLAQSNAAAFKKAGLDLSKYGVE